MTQCAYTHTYTTFTLIYYAQMKHHTFFECIKRRVSCPLKCPSFVVAEHLPNHLKDTCPMRPLACKLDIVCIYMCVYVYISIYVRMYSFYNDDTNNDTNDTLILTIFHNIIQLQLQLQLQLLQYR